MKLMTSRSGRFGISLLAVAGLAGLLAGPAAAAGGTSQSNAYGASIHKVLGIVTVPPTPTSHYQPGGTNSSIPLNLGALGNLGVLTATTAGDYGNGVSSADGKVANVALLKTGALPAVSADAVEASCSQNAPAPATGSSTIVNGKLGGTTLINATPAANTVLLNVPGLVRIVLNQQYTDGTGVFNVNAIHIQLGTAGALGDIVLGHADCGKNTPAVAAFSFGNTPLILGGIAVLLAIAFGLVAGIRRMRPRPQV